MKLVLQLYRVLIWLLNDVDIPQLLYSEIHGLSFDYTYPTQSSSNHSLISSSFDAEGLLKYIRDSNW